MGSDQSRRASASPREGGQFAAQTDRPLTPVGELLEQYRTSRGWSHEKLRAEAGVASPSTYGTVIYGGREQKGEFRLIKSPARTIARFAFALGMDVAATLAVAGYPNYLELPEDIQYNLAVVPTDQLRDELGKRRRKSGK